MVPPLSGNSIVVFLQEPVRVREVSIHRQDIPLTVPGAELSREYGRHLLFLQSCP